MKFNLVDYLSRIGFETPPSPNYQSLVRLQDAHMRHVPFENLDIRRHRPLSLAIDDLFDKIVLRKRGGYCYELNGLFSRMLGALGYSVTMVSARVLRENGSYGPEFDHLALIVHLAGADYLVDVGFGDSTRSPLNFNGNIVRDVSGVYQIGTGSDGVFQFNKEINGEWCAEYLFETVPRQLQDFAAMNEFKQTSPETHFTQKTICSIATTEGRKSMSDNQFIVTTNGDRLSAPIETQEEWNSLLFEHFGMALDNPTTDNQ